MSGVHPDPSAQQIGRLAESLSQARDVFNHDLEVFLIFVGLAHRAALHDEKGCSDRWLSVHGLSESLGIPYETTRRKVHALIGFGLAQRSGHNRLELAHSIKAADFMGPYLRGLALIPCPSDD